QPSARRCRRSARRSMRHSRSFTATSRRSARSRMLAESQRRQMLAAMDIDVYVLREAQPVRAEVRSSNADDAWLIVAVSDNGMKSTQCAQLRKSLPSIIGLTDERVHWILADGASSFESVPFANAYLVLGAAL